MDHYNLYIVRTPMRDGVRVRYYTRDRRTGLSVDGPYIARAEAESARDQRNAGHFPITCPD